MLKKLWSRLNAPFPEPEGWGEAVRSAFTAGVIVMVIVYVVQLNDMPNGTRSRDVFFGSALFGGVTVAVALLFELVFSTILGIRRDVPSWTLLKWMGSLLLLLVCIAIANFLLLNWMQDWKVLHFGALAEMLMSTFLVGAFPITYFGLSRQFKANEQNEQEARHIQGQVGLKSGEKTMITLISQNQQQQIQFKLAQFCFVEAMQNYVAIYYVNGQDLHREILRNTLSNIEEQLQHDRIIRCHRSYLVYLDRIEKVEGNAQGLRLQLAGVADQYVPVSRKYIPILRAAL